MSRRLRAIAYIQSLSEQEGKRQPTAADWLVEQDAKELRKLTRPIARTVRLAPILGRFPFVSI